MFAQGDKAREAESAGADHVGGEDLAQRVQDGFTDFDVAIATPDMMPVVGRLGRQGCRARCRTPKVGTVTDDVGRAVEQAKAGWVEYRTDRTGIIHLVIGRADFDEQRLLENYAAVIEEIARQPRGGERPLHPLGHDVDHDGPWRPHRPDAHPWTWTEAAAA